MISEDDGLIVTSKGMKPKTLATLLNNGESGWWVKPNERCNIVDKVLMKHTGMKIQTQIEIK